MSKQTQSQETSADSLDELGLDDGDYGFIISADGELKHLFTPEEFALYPPKTVQKILKIFGIKDINQVGFSDNDDLNTLH